MTSLSWVVIQYNQCPSKKGKLDTERKPCEEEGKDQGDTSRSHGMSKIDGNHQTPGERCGTDSHPPTFWHLDLRLWASRTGREYVSIVWAPPPPVCGTLYGSPSKCTPTETLWGSPCDPLLPGAGLPSSIWSTDPNPDLFLLPSAGWLDSSWVPPFRAVVRKVSPGGELEEAGLTWCDCGCALSLVQWLKTAGSHIWSSSVVFTVKGNTSICYSAMARSEISVLNSLSYLFWINYLNSFTSLDTRQIVNLVSSRLKKKKKQGKKKKRLNNYNWSKDTSY